LRTKIIAAITCFIASKPLKGFAVELREPSCDCRIERIFLGYISAFERCKVLQTANLGDIISSSLINGSSALEVQSGV